MKRFKHLLILLMIVMSTGLFQSCTKVPAGNVGIKFYLFGNDKGLDYDVLKPGRYWIGYNKELFLFPTFRQTQIWTSDKREGSQNDDDFNFQSTKGLKLSASVSIEYHVTPLNVPLIFETYKTGLDEVTNKVLRNALRNAFNMASSTRTAEEMFGAGKIAFMNAVDSIAKVEAVERGITIDDIFLIGNIVVPNAITGALNAKIKATQDAQRVENELRTTEAEAAKVVVAAQGKAQAVLLAAEAKAQANNMINASITTKLIDYERTMRWNGVVSQVTGGGTPIIDMRRK